jgi:predicted nucleotidyltransferase component of viral defense system
MGQMVLSSHQLNFLELAQAETFIAKRYYLTGDTALAAFYYQHRLSEDLDFFTEAAEVNLLETEKIS